MEPSLKKRRLGLKNSPHDIQLKRARNDQRLKSRFEVIFEKFGKDFSGVGDEIDLETGEIVVDNGHLNSMQDEQDIGIVEQAGTDPRCNASRAAEHCETENSNRRILHRSSDLQGKPKGNLVVRTDRAHSGGALMSLTNERNSLERPIAYDSPSHGDKLHNPKEYLAYEVEANAVDPKWQVPFVPQSHNSRQVELEHESEDEPDSDSASARSMSPPGQSLWATPTYVHKGRQRVVWSAEVKSLLKKASSCMLKDTNTSVEAIDPGARKQNESIANQQALPDQPSPLPQREISFSPEEFSHDIHAHPKRLSNGYWEKKIPDGDLRRRFVRHLYNRRAYMRRIERERGQNHYSNDISDDLYTSKVVAAENPLLSIGKTTSSTLVEPLGLEGSLGHSSPLASTYSKDLTCIEDEVMSNNSNKPRFEAPERSRGLKDPERHEQGHMPVSNASNILSSRKVSNNMQCYRVDDTGATPPDSWEMENVLGQTYSEDAAFSMADVEREFESASNIKFKQPFEIDASLTPCGSMEIEEPSAVARVVNHKQHEPSTSLGHGSTRTKEPKRKPRIVQKLRHKSATETKLSPQQSRRLITPTTPSLSLLTSKVAKHQKSEITGSSLQRVTGIDVPTSDPPSFSERSIEVVDDLEDMLTYASPISLHPTRNIAFLGQAIPISAKSKTKRKRSAFVIHKRPSFHALHGDCSDDELVMSHDTGSGLTPISKGQGKTRKEGIAV